MQASRSRESQWMFHMLVNGFEERRSETGQERVKAYRQQRLKRMVLRNLYEGFAEAEAPAAPRGVARV